GTDREGKPAAPGVPPARGELGLNGARGTRAVPAVHVRGATAPRIPPDVQPLYGRGTLRHPCGYRDSRDRNHWAENPNGRLGDALFVSSRGVRRGRALSRGHLRRALREATRRTYGAISRDQSASGRSCDSRRSSGFVLLGAEHDSKRWRPNAAL